MAVCFTEPLSEVLSEEAAEDQGNKEENHYPNPRRFFQASRQALSPLGVRVGSGPTSRAEGEAHVPSGEP